MLIQFGRNVLLNLHDLISTFLLGFDIPRFAFAFLPAWVAIAMVAYYLVWKYVVGFFNRMLEIGS